MDGEDWKKTGAFDVANGWIAGGCWDDDITNVMTGIIPENSLRKTHQ